MKLLLIRRYSRGNSYGDPNGGSGGKPGGGPETGRPALGTRPAPKPPSVPKPIPAPPPGCCGIADGCRGGVERIDVMLNCVIKKMMRNLLSIIRLRWILSFSYLNGYLL